MRIAISAGHGLHIRGASGNPVPPYLDEYDENVKVMHTVAQFLRSMGVECQTYTDTVSTSQSDNLDRLIDWHNDIAFGGERYDIAVSIHFNAFDGNAHGTECLYVTQEAMAARIASAIAQAAGVTNRGAKYRSDLALLNGTREKCVLVETVFCDNLDDCNRYRQRYDALCEALAAALAGEEIGDIEPPPATQPPPVLFYVRGTCSHFGGEDDTGVSASEGLAFIYPDDFEQYRHLFLPYQPNGTTGMARRLDTERVFYIACRWPYEEGVPKSLLRDHTLKASVRARGREFFAYPADWGPHEEQTGGRVADLSKALMRALFDTDDATDEIVEVLYPALDT